MLLNSMISRVFSRTSFTQHVLRQTCCVSLFTDDVACSPPSGSARVQEFPDAMPQSTAGHSALVPVVAQRAQRLKILLARARGTQAILPQNDLLSYRSLVSCLRGSVLPQLAGPGRS